LAPQEPGDDRGQRREDEDPDALQLGRDAARGDRRERAVQEFEPVASEVGEHGDERAEVQRDVERQVVGGIAPARDPVGQREVRGRRNREKLGEPLDQTQDGRLPGSHDVAR